MPRDEPFRHEQRRVAVGMALAVIMTAVALSVAAFWDPEKTLVVPVVDRLQAALRADVFVIGWLAATIANVARLRFASIDDIAGSSVGSDSQSVRDAVAVLQNTAEQVLLAVVTHLVFAAVIGHPVAMLTTLVTMFCVGRTLFWVGYKRGAGGRALGFALTFYPSVAALGISAAMLLLGNSG